LIPASEPHKRPEPFSKFGKPAEAIPLYEKALGMTTDEDNKKAITTAIEEARAAVKANATPAPGPVPAPK
jgi:hypothetical protein